jgi:tetratricopeptide (TPR) repeat protein
MRISISDDAAPDAAGAQCHCAFPEDASAAQLDLADQPEQASAIFDALGIALLNRGYLKRGRKLIERALEVRVGFYGSDHPTTAASLNSYSRALRLDGRLSDAEREARRALNINARVFGGKGYPLVMSLFELAVVQLMQNDLTGAEQSALSAYSILEALHLDCKDPYAARLLDILGRVQRARGDYERASATYTKVLELDAAQVGMHHPKFAVHLLNAAALKVAQGQLTQAIDEYGKAIEILKGLPQPHPNLADAYSNLGAALRTKGDLPGAREAFDKARKLNAKVRSPNHTSVGHDHANLGRIEFDCGNLAAAAGNFTDALRIYGENVRAGGLSPKHGFIAEALMWQGRVLIEPGTEEGGRKAVDPLQKALAIWETELGERSVEHAFASACMGRALYLQKPSDPQAQSLLNKSYQLIVAARGANSKGAQTIKQWLAAPAKTPTAC